MLSKIIYPFAMSVLIAVMTLGPIGCASSTQITSEPSDAAVRINNIPEGKTPLTYDDSAVWAWTKHHVTVEKPGYENAVGRISAEFVPVYIVLGAIAFFCFFPMAWVALIGEYKPQYHFVLRRKQALETAVLEETPSIDFAQ